MRLKVMTYNLLYGFHERQERSMVFQPERAAAAQEVVRAEAPDVLALTEAVYGGHANRFLRGDYQRMFGLEHLALGCYPGDWGCCLLSRFPIVHAEKMPVGKSARGTTMSGLRAALEIDGRKVYVAIVHPSPHVSESDRVATFRPLLANYPRPYLLLGDFNCLSDEDPYDAATMIEQMRPYVEKPEGLAAKMLDRQVIATIRAAGLRDTLPPERRTHTIPTPLVRPHATEGARLRIDYIFASDEFRVEQSAVIQSPAAERASDHYPLVATLDLPSPPEAPDTHAPTA